MALADVDAVYRVLCLKGLKMHPDDVPAKLARRERETIRRLLIDVDAEDLSRAIEYGMPFVWPFSEDGRPFDAKDLKVNLLKALGESSKRERRSEIPVNLQTVKGRR